MKLYKWYVRNFSIIMVTLVILSIIICFVTAPSIDEELEYPESDYLELEDFVKAYINEETHTINFALEEPEGIYMRNSIIGGIIEIRACKALRNVYISYTATINDKTNITYSRDCENLDELWLKIKRNKEIMYVGTCIILLDILVLFGIYANTKIKNKGTTREIR